MWEAMLECHHAQYITISIAYHNRNLARRRTQRNNDSFARINELFGLSFASWIALAIKDEVEDLEKVGITVIQIDEAALIEGSPLKKSTEDFYLDWVVNAFRITNYGVQNTSQVNLHFTGSNVH